MTYDIDQIELCLSIDDLNTVSDINQANQILLEWYDSNSSLLDALQILHRSGDKKIRFRCLFFLKNYIYRKWIGYSTESHVEIRDSLVNYLIATTDELEFVDIAAECIGMVAVFSILEEWACFWDDIYFDNQADESTQFKKLSVVVKFFQQFNACTYLTQGAKQQLKELSVSMTQRLFEMSNVGLGSPFVAPMALKCMNCILSWTPLQDILNGDLVSQICKYYIGNSETQETAVECLTTIFVRRTDRVMSFRQHAVVIVIAMVSLKDPKNENLPITNNPIVLDFLMSFLAQFLSLIETIFFPNNANANREVKAKNEEDTAYIVEELQKYDVTLEQFGQHLIELFRVVISSNEVPNSNFWKLWYDVMTKIQFEIVNPTNGTPIHEFFMDLLPFIKKNIYEKLPLSVDDDGICVYEARNCWSMILQINYDEMINFLQEQEPSTAFLCAIGCMSMIFEDDDKINDLCDVVLRIMEGDISEADDKFILALIFATSHFTNYLDQKRDDLENVLNFNISCIQASPKYYIAASHAIYYLVQKHTAAFIENDMQLADVVISNSEVFFENLDDESRSRMYKVFIKLIISVNNPEQITQSFTDLFSPFLETFKKFYDNPNENIDICRIALNILSENIDSSDKYGDILVEIFVPYLLEIGPHIYGSTPFYEVSSSLLIALGHFIANSNAEEIMQVIENTLQQLIGTQEGISPVFTFLAIIRSKKNNTNFLYPRIKEHFVLPALRQEPCNSLSEILNMLSVFTIPSEDTEFAGELFVRGISDFSRETNLAAMTFWNKYLHSLKTNINETIIATSEKIFSASFTSITDTLHGSSFEQIVDFIRLLVVMIKEKRLINNDFKSLITTILGNILTEPRQNLYSEFVKYIVSCCSNPNVFQRAFEDLLANLHKVSLVDKDIFMIKNSTQTPLLPQKDKNLIRMERIRRLEGRR